jgi:CubicO group peptidase (beta-lactamase class C family)
MKRIFIATIAVIGIAYFSLHLTGNRHVPIALYKTILHGKLGPDINELNDFATRRIIKGEGQAWPLSTQYNLQVGSSSALQKLKDLETTAFLVIKDDSLLYEWYDLGYDKETLSNSFSMAKSFTAALIGCALKDGLIQSLDEPIGKYVEAYAIAPYDKITLRHALMMSSGLDFKESYGSLFAWPAKAYYGDDVNATIIGPEKIAEPGAVYAYKGGDSQLLGMVIKKVTGMSVAEYAAKRLWTKVGAESDAFWSLDKEGGMEKVSCCYYATARDFARFGKLYLQYGKWDNEQIIDSSFIAQSLLPGAPKKENGEPNLEYGYQWWLLAHEGQKVFYARGIKGQYVFVIPQTKTIVVRLGHKRAEKKGDELPSDIFDWLNLALDL